MAAAPRGGLGFNPSLCHADVIDHPMCLPYLALPIRLLVRTSFERRGNRGPVIPDPLSQKEEFRGVSFSDVMDTLGTEVPLRLWVNGYMHVMPLEQLWTQLNNKFDRKVNGLLCKHLTAHIATNLPKVTLPNGTDWEVPVCLIYAVGRLHRYYDPRRMYSMCNSLEMFDRGVVYPTAILNDFRKHATWIKQAQAHILWGMNRPAAGDASPAQYRPFLDIPAPCPADSQEPAPGRLLLVNQQRRDRARQRRREAANQANSRLLGEPDAAAAAAGANPADEAIDLLSGSDSEYVDDEIDLSQE